MSDGSDITAFNPLSLSKPRANIGESVSVPEPGSLALLGLGLLGLGISRKRKTS